MYSRWLRLLSLLIATLLPIYGVAAVVMPPCSHASGHTATMQDDVSMDSMDEGCPMHGEQPPPASQGCDRCGVCHLVAGGCLLMEAATPSIIATVETFHPPLLIVPVSVIPEPPTHPPRRLA